MSDAAPDRELLVSDAPALVAEWCRERVTPGTLFVAPSAAARRLALRHVVERTGVTLGVTITARSQLLSRLESRAGLTAPDMLPPALERMLAGTCAREARVPMFDEEGVDAPAGAVHAIATLVRALRNNRVTPERYVDAGGDPRAAEACRRFERRRESLGMHDDVARLDRVLAAGVPALRLVVEDPVPGHRASLDLLAALAGAAASCHVGVAAFGEEAAGAESWRRLEALGLPVRRANAPPHAPAMRAIGGVGMLDEVELVARHMRAVLRAGGDVRDGRGTRPVRPGDLLGIAPNATYLALLGEACARAGLPVASPRRVRALDVPLVRALLETARLLADPSLDTPERGLALLGTPYTGLSLGTNDRLARELVRQGRGELRSWRRVAHMARRGRFPGFAEAVPRLAERLAGERPLRELAALLGSLALDHGFLSAGRRRHLAAGREDAVRLDQQGWEAVSGAIAELEGALRALGVERRDARTWLAELTELLEDASVRIEARPVDGVHLTLAGAGIPPAAHVFAVGWQEGVFPRRVREAPFLPDTVKQALNAEGALFPLAADRVAMEHARRERIRRAALESLTISWPATGAEGERVLPSFYLDDLGVTERSVRSVGDTTWPVSLAASRTERLARATFLSRHRPADAIGDELREVRAALSRLTPAERRAWDGSLHARATSELPDEARREAAELARAMSASQAQQLAHCGFEHFGKHRLALEPLAAPVVNQLVLGTIAHGVLCDVGRAGFDAALLSPILERRWNVAVAPALREEPESVFQREVLHAQLATVLEQERERIALVAGKPAFFELAFGLADRGSDDGGRDAASRAAGVEIVLPAGSPIDRSVVRGSIDRVDVVEVDGARYGVAIDYKLGKGESNWKETQELADFQLSIYCDALPAFGIAPVGAWFLGIAEGAPYGVVRADFAERFLPEKPKGVTALSPEEFADFLRVQREALAGVIARAARGEVETRPRNDDCKWCDLRPVCRIGTLGVGGSRGEE